MVLLWLGSKWPPQHNVGNLPSWAGGKDGQEVVGNAGASV